MVATRQRSTATSSPASPACAHATTPTPKAVLVGSYKHHELDTQVQMLQEYAAIKALKPAPYGAVTTSHGVGTNYF